MRFPPFLVRSFRVGLLLAMALLIFPFTQQGQSPYPRQYITVAGKKMSYTRFGLTTRRPGSPVLIFEAGFGASGSIGFKQLFPALSKFAAGIGYDRNGEGGSEEDTTLVTDGDIIRRLHAFLEAVRVPPPYLLVGHSLGGPFIRLFTALYPAEVAGLVFIDPPDFMLTDEQTHQIDTVVHKDVGAGIIRSLDSTVADTLWGPLVRHRTRRLANLFRKGIFQEYHALPPLPDIPVAILIAYNKPLGTMPRTAAELARSNVIDHFRLENFTTMIGNNHHSELIVLPGYGHIIHGEDPALVVATIERIYRSAKGKRRGGS